jgi:hypothetical protein
MHGTTAEYKSLVKFMVKKIDLEGTHTLLFLKTRDSLGIKKGNNIDQARKRMFAVKCRDTRAPPALRVQIHLLSPCPAATTFMVHPRPSSCAERSA